MPSLFSNYAGQSVGIAVPTSAPRLYSITTASRSTTKPTITGEVYKASVKPIVDFASDVAGGFFSAIGDLATSTLDITLEVLGADANTVTNALKELEEQQKEFGTPSEETYFALNDASSPDLNDLIKKLGYIVSVEGSYSEDIDYSVEVVTSVPKFKLARYVIRGISFAGDEGGNRIRHGIEGVLQYYGFTRISNNKNTIGLSEIAIKIGQTVIPKCYVVGLDFQPAEPTSRIWSWALILAAQANIKPVALPNSSVCVARS